MRRNFRGGLSEGVPLSAFNQRELERGAKVELEHTGDIRTARRIAADHLTEDPHYYHKLESCVEKGMKQNPIVRGKNIDVWRGKGYTNIAYRSGSPSAVHLLILSPSGGWSLSGTGGKPLGWGRLVNGRLEYGRDAKKVSPQTLAKAQRVLDQANTMSPNRRGYGPNAATAKTRAMAEVKKTGDPWQCNYDPKWGELSCLLESRDPQDDATVSVTFDDLPDLLKEGRKVVPPEAHVHFSLGADYEGHFGVKQWNEPLHSFADVRKVLDKAAALIHEHDRKEAEELRRLGYEPNAKRVSRTARDLAGRIMRGYPTPHDLSVEFHIPVTHANYLLKESALYFGPGGKGVDAYEKLVDRTLKREKLAEYAPNVRGAGSYWVWLVQPGTNQPMTSEGPHGPHDLRGAKTFARIGATKGSHDRAVSKGRDPRAPGFEIVRVYRAGSGNRAV